MTTMTVRELYNKLGEFLEEYGDRDVMSEGCDCDGNVADVVLDGDGVIYLMRKSAVVIAEEARKRQQQQEEYEKVQWNRLQNIKHLLPEGHNGP